MLNLLAMMTFPGVESDCPECGKPYQGDELIHIECLREKHGGTLPEGFEKLIEAFELTGTNNDR